MRVIFRLERLQQQQFYLSEIGLHAQQSLQRQMEFGGKSGRLSAQFREILYYRRTGNLQCDKFYGIVR